MKRTIALCVLMACLCALLLGCSGTEQATFVRYRVKTTGYRTVESNAVGAILSGTQPSTKQVPVLEGDGTAVVTLSGGAAVVANCSILSITAGQPVTVRSLDNGTWAVVSAP